MTSSTNLSLAQRLNARIQVDNATKQRQQTDNNEDSLLFVGNWHDAVPRALILDPLLQPADKCVYLLLRTYLSAHGTQRMPSYTEISRLLVLSRGTIARCLHILRATRWITMCNAIRDDQTGKFKKNIYALHDEMLSVEEVVVLDGHYIEALEDMERNHAHKRVRVIAHAVLENIRNNLNRNDFLEQNPQSKFVSRFLYDETQVQNLDKAKLTPQVQVLDSVKKNIKNHTLNTQVQNLDSDASLCSSSCSNKTTTTAEAQQRERTEKNTIDPNLIWPQGLEGDGKWLCWQSLKKCPVGSRQDVLDELGARMLQKQIKNPAGWVAWASNELANNGIYPITTLSLNFRKAREREQYQAKDDEVKKQEIANFRATQPTRKIAKQNIANLRSRLGARGNRDG
jgi:hypothetical protein